MDKQNSRINTVALVVIAASLAVIAYAQLQPTYVLTDKGLLNTRSGTFFHQVGSDLTPVAPTHETTEDRLRREYPGGKTY